MTYRDAWLEMAGVPVMYTPYLSHPDATVKRRSGFLAPSVTSSSSNGLGTIVSVPYYAVLGQQRYDDRAHVGQASNPVLGGEYRQRFEAGEMTLNASATSAERRDDNNAPVAGEQFRGHIKGDGKFDINEDWRWGFNVARATDDTYLQRYKLLNRYQFPSSTTLMSRAYTEGFYGRSYAAANAYAFQGLRPQDESRSDALRLPDVRLQLCRRTGIVWREQIVVRRQHLVRLPQGGHARPARLFARGLVAALHRQHGRNLHTERQRPRLSLQHQRYRSGDQIEPADPEDGVQARAFPQASLEWRYPFVNRGETFRTIVEPTISFIAAPNVGTQSRFPNEDSRSVDFDDTSLFRLNRFSGTDRLEGGQRVVYGLNTNISRITSRRATAFLSR